MSELLGTYEDVTGFLRAEGWSSSESGSRGSVWRRGENDPPVAVPFGVTESSDAWRDAVDRIASTLHRDYRDVAEEVRRFYVDVQTLRAETGDGGGSVLVDAGYHLFATGRTLMRVASTTSRTLKVQIAGRYSTKGLEIADKARFGQTRIGSYVVPLLMPLERPAPAEAHAPALVTDDGVEHAYIEPKERQVTRTLAQAVTAIQNYVVEPANEPRASIVTPLVSAGVTREMVSSIAALVSSPGVAGFEISFKWSPAFEPPAIDFPTVAIPSGSQDLLLKTASFMKSEKRHQGELLRGRIINLHDDDVTDFRRVTLRTIRKGRSVLLDVHLDESMTDRAHEWFRSREEIAVSGIVRSVPGVRITIERPDQFAPIDDIVLVKAEEGSPAPQTG